VQPGLENQRKHALLKFDPGLQSGCPLKTPQHIVPIGQHLVPQGSPPKMQLLTGGGGGGSLEKLGGLQHRSPGQQTSPMGQHLPAQTSWPLGQQP